ncbi:putative DNA-binding protein HU, partial [Neospora caninum Liverpool]
QLLLAESFKVPAGGSFSSITSTQSFVASGKYDGKPAFAAIQESVTAGPQMRRVASALSIRLPDGARTSNGRLSAESFTLGPLRASSAAGETAEDDEASNASTSQVVTRKDLVASVAAELQLSRADVERTVGALLRHIAASLEQGQKVSISKFGSFGLRRRGERVARNPRTGEPLNVPATTFPTFSFSKVLKDKVRDVMPAHEDDGDDDSEEPKKKGLFSWN